MLTQHSRSAVPAFLIGVVTGLFLKEAVQRLKDRARRTQTHLEHERTVVYDENMPEPLERREPAPEHGQPRFGGTGAIGFSPAAAAKPKPSDTSEAAPRTDGDWAPPR
jgi:hypothetical protein